jgi:translation initiation factor IF-1
VKKFKPRSNHRKRRPQIEERKDIFMYFDNGIVTETLPGTTFKVKVTRESSDETKSMPPIMLVCNLKTILIKKRVIIIKGDNVIVEVNPEDMYYDIENNILKGTIIRRK